MMTGFMFSLLRNISLRDLASRPFRVGLFVVSIALGVGLLTATLLASEAVIRDFNAQVDKIAGRAALQITFGTGESRFSEELTERVGHEPFVKRAAALVRGTLSFADGSGELLELFGVDLLKPEVQKLYDVTVVERTADDFSILNDPYGVFLTERVAAERGLKLDDRVRLASAIGTREYTVRGLIRGEGLPSSYGERVAIMYLPAAQGVLGLVGADGRESPIDRIDVELKAGVSPPVAARALQEDIAKQLVVLEPAQRKLANRKLVSGLRATLIGISAFVLLAAVFIVYATTVALVSYRTPMLATLIRTGSTPVSVVRLVIVEAALLGLVGGILGALSGILMAKMAVADVAAGMSLNYSLPFAAGRSSIPPVAYLLWLPWLGAGAAAVSAYGPARRLGKLDPLSLRQVGVADDPDKFSAVSYFGLGGGIAVAASIVALLARRSGSAAAFSGAVLLLWPACIIVSLPVVRILWIRLGRAKKGLGRTTRWLAVELLNRNVERSLITVAAISLSIGVVIAASTLPESFRRSISQWYAFYGDAVVTSRTQQGGWLAAAVTDDYADTISRLPGVAAVDTLRVLQGQPYAGDRIAIASLGDGYLRYAMAGIGELRGSQNREAIESIRDGSAAAISENMRVHYGLAIGDTIELVSPTGPLELRIAAVVPDFISDRGSVILGRRLFERRWRDHLANYIALSLKPGVSLRQVRRQFRLQAGADAESVSVLSIGELVAHIDDAIALAFADLDALQLLVILITLAGIVDLVVSSVFDSRGIQATLRAVGMTDRGIVRVIVYQAGVVGFTAGVCGVVLGFVASWLWVHVAYPLLVGYVLHLHMAWGSAIVCVVLSTLTAMFAGAVAGASEVRALPAQTLLVE